MGVSSLIFLLLDPADNNPLRFEYRFDLDNHLLCPKERAKHVEEYVDVDVGLG